MIALFSRPTTANAALFLTLTMLFWAGNHVVGRWAGGHIPPMTLACLRWIGATALLAPFAWRYVRDDWEAVRARLPFLILLGVVGVGLFNTLQYISLVHTTATSSAVLNSVVPVLIVVMSYFILRQPISALQCAGIVTSLLGVLVVVSRGAPETLLALELNKGDLYMLGATSLWALYSVLLQKRPKIHALSFALVTYFVAALLNIPLSLGEIALGGQFDVTPATVAALLYIVVLPSLLANLLFNRGVEIVGATRAGVFLHLVPMFTAVLAMVFLGEQPSWFHAAGFVLILSGVGLGSRSNTPTRG
jgi:drug/metabolite transporter (DMT)-like permease